MTIQECIKRLDSTDCWDKDVQALDMATEAMAEAAAALKRANERIGVVCVQGSPDVAPAPEVE